jgi:enoyl-CoA hydratase/carnithine racemase
MSLFGAYRDSFPNARLTRSESGVLEVALHTDGGTLVFNGHTHEQFVDLFHTIGSDRDNRVVILTGSGTAFMESISPEGFDFFSPQGYDKIYREGKKVLMNKIVPPNQLLTRAHEIAEGLAKLPRLTSSYTRIALIQKLRRIIDEGIGYGLALEGISAADVARSLATKR